MSPRSSRPTSGGPYRKPRADVYTLMLALALVAIVIGCICLIFEVADYERPLYQLGLAVPTTLDRCVAGITPWSSAADATRCGDLVFHG